MTDYTDPLGKWWLENKTKFALMNGYINSLAMLRAYDAEVVQPQLHKGLDITAPLCANHAQTWFTARNEVISKTGCWFCDAEAELAEARRDSARLLQKYGNHLPRCPKYSFHKTGTFTPECDCGLDAAMTEAQPKEP